MRREKTDRSFPVVRLARAPLADDPAAARKQLLKELAERFDQHNVFTKGQFVTWKPELMNR